MSYRTLFEKLPKKTKLWTVSDIEIWLNEINMEVLYPRFSKLSVDGSCIAELEQRDLRDQIGIKSQITIDKIMKWVEYRFREYDQYLQQVLNDSEYLPLIDEQKSAQYEKDNVLSSAQFQQKNYHRQKYVITTRRNMKIQSRVQRPFFRSQKEFQDVSNSYSFSRNNNTSNFQNAKMNNHYLEEQKLFIYNKSTKDALQIEKTPFDIGSSDHSSFQLQSHFDFDEEPVDGRHALITQQKYGAFQIKDMNSISGTYIKISQPLKLYSRSELLIQSNRFHIDIFEGCLFLSCSTLGIKMQIRSYENIYLPHSNSTKVVMSQIPLHNSWLQLCSIRKKQNFFILYPFSEDADIFIKLIPKKGYQIKDNTIIKIGTNLLKFNYFRQEYPNSFPYLMENLQTHQSFNQFPCNHTNLKQHSLSRSVSRRHGQILNKAQQLCVICCENARNCLILECRHYVMCLQCGKGLTQCPICRSPIIQLQRVYFQE